MEIAVVIKQPLVPLILLLPVAVAEPAPQQLMRMPIILRAVRVA
jgi:hypothetical protein